MKDWNDIKSHDSWEIFKIMGEFVEVLKGCQGLAPVYPFLVLQEQI